MLICGREETLLGFFRFRFLHRRTSAASYLSPSVSLNVAFEDLFGPGGQPEGRLDLLIVLAHQPKLNVLVAELGLQEGLEDLYPV